MGSLVARILGAVAAAVLSVTMFASGVASADGLTGKTYDDAAAYDLRVERQGCRRHGERRPARDG